MPLNFEAAERTRGGYKYKIFGEVPTPTYTRYPIVGIFLNKYDNWQLATWSRNGREAFHTCLFDPVDDLAECLVIL